MKLVECSNAEYHGERDHLSSSNYKMVLKDLQKFYNEKILGLKGVEEVKDHYTDGSYLHSLILEPEKVDEEYAFFTGMRKAGKDYELFKSENEGKMILGVNQRKRVEEWFSFYDKCEVAKELISGGKPELSLFGDLNGIKTKVRADYLNADKGYIVDVKTSSFGLDVEDFKQTMNNFNYQLSASLYLKMFELYYNKPFEFYFLVLGKTELGCKVFRLGVESRKQGELEISKASKIYKQCLASGQWFNEELQPCISDGIEEV